MADMEWKTQEEVDAEKNQKSDIQVLQENQADLVMTLMMNGVL